MYIPNNVDFQVLVSLGVRVPHTSCCPTISAFLSGDVPSEEVSFRLEAPNVVLSL